MTNSMIEIRNKCMMYASNFYLKNGHINVPGDYMVGDICLGLFIKQKYKMLKSNKLSDDELKFWNRLELNYYNPDDDWHNIYNIAKKYYDSRVYDFLCDNQEYDGVQLKRWLSEQRIAYEKGMLDEQKNRLLENISIDKICFGNDIVIDDNDWYSYYSEILKYYKNNGNIHIPDNYLVDDKNVGMWFLRQKKIYTHEINATLDKSQLELLDRIGIKYYLTGTTWFKNFSIIKNLYMRDFDILNLIKSINGYQDLLTWLTNFVYVSNNKDSFEREYYKDISLSIKFSDYIWLVNYSFCGSYYLEKGNCLIGDDYSINGYKIGQWLFKQKKLKKNESGLTSRQIKLLNGINVEWDICEKTWIKYYNLAADYYNKFNSLDIPNKYVVDGARINDWIRNERKLYNSNKEEYDKTKFRLLSSIGMDFGIKRFSWDDYYKEASNYFNKHGNLDITFDYSVGNLKLGKWISKQRYQYNNKLLDGDKVELLRSIGFNFEFSIPSISWDDYYLKATQYYNEFGNLYIPVNYVVDDIKLGSWIANQRRKYNNGLRLDMDKIKKLEAIGMIWRINSGTINNTWMSYYNKAVDYYNEFGNLLIPSNYTVGEFKLGLWIVSQRRIYSGGKCRGLDIDKVKLLNNIGMVWKCNLSFDDYYRVLIEYKNEFGDILVPSNYSIDGIKLGHFVSNLREYYKKNAISGEKIELLNKLGMVWDLNEKNWNDCYKLAMCYYLNNGNLNIPDSYVVDGVKLGKWITRQKYAYIGKGTWRITSEQIQLLNEIGMVWDNCSDLIISSDNISVKRAKRR